MNTPHDVGIEAFRQTVERLATIPGQLSALSVTLARANDLPGLIAATPYPDERRRLREEQSAIGYSNTHRIRRFRLESELRQGMYAARETLRSAIDAATEYVGIAAGGPEAVRTFPFARRHLEELARHRTFLPASMSTEAALRFLESAWLAIDAAMGSLGEIRFDSEKSSILLQRNL